MQISYVLYLQKVLKDIKDIIQIHKNISSGEPVEVVWGNMMVQGEEVEELKKETIVYFPSNKDYQAGGTSSVNATPSDR